MSDKDAAGILAFSYAQDEAREREMKQLRDERDLWKRRWEKWWSILDDLLDVF